jgi:hypothetical protein
MMRFLCLILCCLFTIHSAFATSNPAPGSQASPTSPAGGAAAASGGGATSTTCDFEELKASLRETESANAACGQAGSNSSSQGATAGRYQFVPETWASMSKGCPNAAQCPHSRAGTAACCQTEECAMNNLLASNMAAIKRNPNCQKILGKQIMVNQTYCDNKEKCGIDVKGGTRKIVAPYACPNAVSMSGLLAAFHLGGTDACDGPAQGGYGDDDCQGSCIGTYEATYICKHSGKGVPTDCTPSQQGDPYTGGPVGTLQQIQIQEAQGQLIITGPADPLKEWWVWALMQMAEQFTVNMTLQIQGIGKLLDAKHQMETQELLQRKVSEAHKDYQPSEQMCTFGTFARDLATTEREADLTKETIAKKLTQRELGQGVVAGKTQPIDRLSRLRKYIDKFCDPADNGQGLKNLCPTPAPAETRNADINFTQTLDQKLSLKINMDDNETTTDEEAVFALVDNLFAHENGPRIDPEDMKKPKAQYAYFNYRSIVAMRGIVRNSMATIIAMKTETPYNGKNGMAVGSAPFMRALLKEFGLTPDEITKMIGENPSYYAQMELLTKKIYQNPLFYTNLYDKPANVKRMRAAMQAVKMMQDRDIMEALHRREMLLSMMLELNIRERADSVYNASRGVIFRP